MLLQLSCSEALADKILFLQNSACQIHECAPCFAHMENEQDKPTNAASAAGVFAAVNKIMTDLCAEGGIGKCRDNSQGWKFRGIDDVYNALSPLLSKHKLVILPHSKFESFTERTSLAGKAIYHATVSVSYTLATPDGSMFMVGPIKGEAMDNGDKALGKAYSYAYKTMMLQMFCVPTEGDNDPDAHEHELAPAQQRQPQQQRQAPAQRQQYAKTERQSKKDAPNWRAYKFGIPWAGHWEADDTMEALWHKNPDEVRKLAMRKPNPDPKYAAADAYRRACAQACIAEMSNENESNEDDVPFHD